MDIAFIILKISIESEPVGFIYLTKSLKNNPFVLF